MDAIPNFQEFATLYDPVHGVIDLTDIGGSRFSGTIKRVLSSPMLDRLRRIKQLGFASYSHLAADHSRFAHALGTMQVMRMIAGHFRHDEQFPADQFAARFPKAFDGANERIPTLLQYMLMAALLQDIGELPYETATRLVFRPAPQVIRRVTEKVGFSVEGWQPKDVFSLAFLFDDESTDYLNGFDRGLLAFLIAGKHYPLSDEEFILTRCLQMLDGDVDADRLDYVYRDAHHTVGARGTSQSVLDSLVRFDEQGPVFGEVGPIADFLFTRAVLWNNVYLAPHNRFRRVLLFTLLNEIFENGDKSNIFRKHGVEQELDINAFKRLDDVWLWERLRELRSSSSGGLAVRAKRALELLTNERVDYGHTWLPEPDDTSPDDEVPIPEELFFDTYGELYWHSLYDPDSIRIDADNLAYVGRPVPLRRFGGIFAQDWPSLPLPKAIQLFLPRQREGREWELFDSRRSSRALFSSIRRADKIKEREVSTDTRDQDDFLPPDIFISYRETDIDTVDEVLKVLLTKRRRFYIIRNRYLGSWDYIGETPPEGSRRAVKEAGAILCLVSKSYTDRYHQDSNGNIAIEIGEMIHRKDDVPIAFLTVDEWSHSKTLPWASLIGQQVPPDLGAPLKKCTRKALGVAVEKALHRIATWKRP
jgi:HD superfamily phosphohydrolase